MAVVDIAIASGTTAPSAPTVAAAAPVGAPPADPVGAPPADPVGAAPADPVGAAQREQTRALASLVAAIGDAVRRSAFAGEGHRSAVSWLMAKVALSFRTARELVEVAEALQSLPHLAGAFAASSVTFDQLRVLVRIATPSDDEALARSAPSWSFAQTEAHVREEEVRRADLARRRAAEAARRRRELDAARGTPPAVPGTAAAATGAATADSTGAGEGLFGAGPAPAGGGPARDVVSGDAPGTALAGAVLPGWLRLRPGRGGGHLEGFLPDERFTALKGRLEALAEDMGPDPLTKRRAPFAERLAEALSTAVGSTAGHHSAGADRPLPEIVVHADVGLLDGSADGTAVATVDGAGPLGAEVLRRLACEAHVRLAADADGVTVDLGRRRRVPSRALSTEVARRDRTCRFPGCTLTAHLQIHHLVPWADGGCTDLSNLALHCYRDHLRLHHGGWTVDGDANGELRYTSPEGRVFRSVPDPGWTATRSRLRRGGPSPGRPPDRRPPPRRRRA